VLNLRVSSTCLNKTQGKWTGLWPNMYLVPPYGIEASFVASTLLRFVQQSMDLHLGSWAQHFSSQKGSLLVLRNKPYCYFKLKNVAQETDKVTCQCQFILRHNTRLYLPVTFYCHYLNYINLFLYSATFDTLRITWWEGCKIPGNDVGNLNLRGWPVVWLITLKRTEP